MISPKKRLELEKQGYRLVGNHSAIKVCLWCKKAIKGIDNCYKHQFYGINSWQCIQMTTALPFCTLRCQWCWRDIEHTVPKWNGPVDSPAEIIDGCLLEHKKFLMGFLGDNTISKPRFMQAMKPRHFAISLAGEPTLYPRLPELIKELNKRKITSFLVTNGTNPAMLRKLKKSPVTQLYLTIPAPNKAVFEKSCKPIIRDAWKKIMESARIFKDMPMRKTIRLTIAKGLNMADPEGYAQIINIAKPDFVEVKAYMHVGYSAYRLSASDMPLHSEIIEFARQIARAAKLKLVDEKALSRVVLLMKKDSKDRKLKLNWLAAGS